MTPTHNALHDCPACKGTGCSENGFMDCHCLSPVAPQTCPTCRCYRPCGCGRAA